ncbi:MAG: arylsulfatase [Akkermansiaceae bacterium]|nr:arylsulfatase [Akkermansiaceae bacterium]
MRHLLFFTLAACCPLSAAGAERPNILLVYTDDVGYGDVGCYEGSKTPTPNIDRLAREGIKFTDAHCSAATCTPSRFALLTGQYAFRQKGTGIASGNAGMVIRPDTHTIADILRKAGYTTGVVGKWHLGLGAGKNDWNKEIKPNPADLGFDYHFLMPATGDRVPCVYFEQGRVVGLDPADPIEVSYGKRIGSEPSGKEARDTLKQDWSHGHNSTIVNGISRIGWMTGGKKARWVDEDMADVFTGKALDFLARSTSRRQPDAGKPFFLFFSTHDIHVPRVPHSRFAGKSGQGPRGDAMVQADWCVGELLGFLDDNELAENTLVIFASDNGPVLDDGYKDQANEKLGEHDPNGPWRAGKYSLFEGGTRTPFLVRWPARVKGGQTSGALFGQIDLARSFASLVGVDVPGGACGDSRDELDTLLGEDRTGRPHLVHEAGRLSLRLGQWKFVPPGKTRDQLGPWPKNAQIPAPGALYDTRADRAEQRNLASEKPEKLNELRSLLARIRQAPDR